MASLRPTMPQASLMNRVDANPRRLMIALALAVLVRMVFHAAYVPVFEGPDEPFHLARASVFLDGTPREAFEGGEVSGEIVSAIRDYPCSESLANAFRCERFGATSESFNVFDLHPRVRARPAEPSPNYEAHQPPLYYAAGALVLELEEALPLQPLLDDSPRGRLLAMRLFSVGLVFAGMILIARSASPEQTRTVVLPMFGLLLVPGASEALARCANDAGLFLWTAALIGSLRTRTSAGWLGAIFAIGPLVKLTALPLVAFGVVYLYQEGRRRLAVAGAAGSLLFLAVQALRGWGWGGTVELNAQASTLPISLGELAYGMARSGYTFVKTALWLGEWSFFKAPLWILALVAVFAIVWAAGLRCRPRARNVAAHLAGLGALVVGIVVFFVKHRLYFGQWGGVGGWYVWAWVPWIVHGIDDLTVRDNRRWHPWMWGAAILAVTTFLWMTEAHRLYG